MSTNTPPAFRPGAEDPLLWEDTDYFAEAHTSQRYNIDWGSAIQDELESFSGYLGDGDPAFELSFNFPDPLPDCVSGPASPSQDF